MTDLLLSHGYFLKEDPLEQRIMKPYPPLGILYLSSHLKAKGFDVEIFDSTFEDEQSFAKEITGSRPPVVGFYCNLMTRSRLLRLMKVCRQAGSLVIAGGPDAVNYAEEYLSQGADIVVIGEGELTLEELLPHLKTEGPQEMEHIHGIVYKKENGEVVRTPARELIKDLNAQPFPDREAINIQRYVDVWREFHGTGSVSLITARGCPYTCKWCSHSVFGYTHRRRSVENVVAELQHIITTWGPDIVWYADDVFTMNRRWLEQLDEALSGLGLRAPFETISREDRLDERVVKTLANLGCYRLWLGAESGSQRILDAMQRKTSAENTRAMTHLLQKHGIEVGMFIMLGYDGEEIADIEESVNHLKEAGPDIFLTTVAYPIKGTPYYEDVADRLIALQAWEVGSDRDLTIAGRHSKRFYQQATRWMVNEVALHRALRAESRDYLRVAISFAKAKVGRLGMALTRREVESRKAWNA